MPELLSICSSAPKGCGLSRCYGLADFCTMHHANLSIEVSSSYVFGEE